MKKPESPEAVGSELLRAPYNFEFLAAMRLLEAMSPHRRSVAEGDDPRAEGVRFNTRPHLDFQPGELRRHRWRRAAPAILSRWLANFFGLAQANGPLPYSFAEELIDRAFRRDHAGGAFLDLFHHRLIWRSSSAPRKKYRPASDPPAARPRPGRLDPRAPWPASAPAASENRLAHARPQPGSSCPASCSAPAAPRSGSSRRCGRHFALDAEVLPFRGAFKKLEGHQTTRLGTLNSVLRGPGDPGADGAMLGDRVFVADAGFELRLGPLDDEGLERLLPGSRRFAALADLVHFYTDHRYDVALRALVAAGAPRPLAGCTGVERAVGPARLGCPPRRAGRPASAGIPGCSPGRPPRPTPRWCCGRGQPAGRRVGRPRAAPAAAAPAANRASRASRARRTRRRPSPSGSTSARPSTRPDRVATPPASC